MVALKDLVGLDRAETSVARAAHLPAIEHGLAELVPYGRTASIGATSAQCPCWILPHGPCACPHHALHKRAFSLFYEEGYPEDAVRGAYSVMFEMVRDDIYQMMDDIESIVVWMEGLGIDFDQAKRSATKAWANGLRPSESFVDHEGHVRGQCEVCGEMLVELISTRNHGQVCFDCLTWVAPQQADAFPRPTFMERVNLGTLPTRVQGGSIVADPWAPSGA